MKTSESTRADRRSVRQRARRLGCRGGPDEMICVVAAAADTAFVGSGRRWSGRQQPGWQGILFDAPIVAAGNLPRPGPVDFGHAAGKIFPSRMSPVPLSLGRRQPKCLPRSARGARDAAVPRRRDGGCWSRGEARGIGHRAHGRPKTPIVPGNSARRLTPASGPAEGGRQSIPRAPPAESDAGSDVSRRARPQPGPASLPGQHPGTPAHGDARPGIWGTPPVEAGRPLAHPGIRPLAGRAGRSRHPSIPG